MTISGIVLIFKSAPPFITGPSEFYGYFRRSMRPPKDILFFYIQRFVLHQPSTFPITFLFLLNPTASQVDLFFPTRFYPLYIYIYIKQYWSIFPPTPTTSSSSRVFSFVSFVYFFFWNSTTVAPPSSVRRSLLDLEQFPVSCLTLRFPISLVLLFVSRVFLPVVVGGYFLFTAREETWYLFY